MSAPDLPARCDIAVIGAGPAGLAAATTAARAGLSTVLFDEQPAPGGQVQRAATTTPLADPVAILGVGQARGVALARDCAASGARILSGATVWSVAADGTLVLDTSTGRVHVSSGSLTHPADVWRGDERAITSGVT